MTQKNQFSSVITADDKNEVIRSINALHDKLAMAIPFHLTKDERVSLNKMSNKMLAFVEKTMECAHHHPELVPDFLNVQEAEKDLVLSRDLYEILQVLKPFIRAIEDAMMVSCSEAYEAGLLIYSNVKGASKNNAPCFRELYDDLHKHFPRMTKKIVHQEY